jgi:hypothetical protein
MKQSLPLSALAILLAALGALTACAELELGCETLQLMTTETYTLTASQPGNVTTSSDLVSTTWSSSDPDVVRVDLSADDPRVVTLVALKGGTADIEVAEGGAPDVCTVTVEAAAQFTIEVTDEAFQMVEPKLGDLQLGDEGYNPVLDETAFFIDSGASFTVLAPTGEHELTFWSSTNWALGSEPYRLVPPVVLEDGVPLTRTFTGEADEYETVP